MTIMIFVICPRVALADQAPAPQAVQEPQEAREDRVPRLRRVSLRGLRAAAVSFSLLEGRSQHAPIYILGHEKKVERC